MIKKLKLQKALLLIVLGFILFLTANSLTDSNLNLSSFLLGMSGVFLICGSILFLYPIFSAKKVSGDGKRVELRPLSEKNEQQAFS